MMEIVDPNAVIVELEELQPQHNAEVKTGTWLGFLSSRWSLLNARDPQARKMRHDFTRSYTNIMAWISKCESFWTSDETWINTRDILPTAREFVRFYKEKADHYALCVRDLNTLAKELLLRDGNHDKEAIARCRDEVNSSWKRLEELKPEPPVTQKQLLCRGYIRYLDNVLAMMDVMIETLRGYTRDMQVIAEVKGGEDMNYYAFDYDEKGYMVMRKLPWRLENEHWAQVLAKRAEFKSALDTLHREVQMNEDMRWWRSFLVDARDLDAWMDSMRVTIDAESKDESLEGAEAMLERLLKHEDDMTWHYTRMYGWLKQKQYHILYYSYDRVAMNRTLVELPEKKEILFGMLKELIERCQLRVPLQRFHQAVKKVEACAAEIEDYHAAKKRKTTGGIGYWLGRLNRFILSLTKEQKTIEEIMAEQQSAIEVINELAREMTEIDHPAAAEVNQRRLELLQKCCNLPKMRDA